MNLKILGVIVVCAASACLAVGSEAQDQDDEIVATLAGGRVILHASKENITFIALDEPMESGSIPPRVITLDGRHVGVLLGASEWKIPAEPAPIRLDRNNARITGSDPNYRGSYNGEAEPDLETIGVAFLERLTPLAARLHHKLDFPADQPLLEMVVIGYGPQDYGPEVWTVEYRMSQSMVASRGDFWQTRVLRPRFTQVYPPEKRAPRKLVELCYPAQCQGPSLQQLLEANEPTLEKLAKSDPKYLKAVDLITKGQSQKAVSADAAAYLRAAIPLIYTGKHFVMGTFEEQHGFDWVVPPDEPIEKAKATQEKKQQPTGAPTLRRSVDPP